MRLLNEHHQPKVAVGQIWSCRGQNFGDLEVSEVKLASTSSRAILGNHQMVILADGFPSHSSWFIKKNGFSVQKDERGMPIVEVGQTWIFIPDGTRYRVDTVEHKENRALLDGIFLDGIYLKLTPTGFCDNLNWKMEYPEQSGLDNKTEKGWLSRMMASQLKPEEKALDHEGRPRVAVGQIWKWCSRPSFPVLRIEGGLAFFDSLHSMGINSDGFASSDNWEFIADALSGANDSPKNSVVEPQDVEPAHEPPVTVHSLIETAIRECPRELNRDAYKWVLMRWFDEVGTPKPSLVETKRSISFRTEILLSGNDCHLRGEYNRVLLLLQKPLLGRPNYRNRKREH